MPGNTKKEWRGERRKGRKQKWLCHRTSYYRGMKCCPLGYSGSQGRTHFRIISTEEPGSWSTSPPASLPSCPLWLRAASRSINSGTCNLPCVPAWEPSGGGGTVLAVAAFSVPRLWQGMMRSSGAPFFRGLLLSSSAVSSSSYCSKPQGLEARPHGVSFISQPGDDSTEVENVLLIPRGFSVWGSPLCSLPPGLYDDPLPEALLEG